MSKDALIIGGNLAGSQAALDLADAGLRVHLVESSPFLSMPGTDLPRHVLNSRWLEVIRHPHIQLWTRTLLNRIERQDGYFRVELRKQPRYVDLTRCTACGKCIDVCPVTLPDNSQIPATGYRKAIFLGNADGQAVQPGCMAIDKDGKPPCANTCPGGIHVQGYIALVAQGRFQEAIDLIRQAIPFPGICGRVCTHPCEINCRRAEFDKPVAVRLLKRFLSDWEQAHGERRSLERPIQSSPRSARVAVVGAGPGGLAVAERLARLGYQVTVFEKLPVVGGMMAVGIPEYRLPYQVISREYQQIQGMGVEIRLNTAVGPGGEFCLDDLFANGYQAVCLAVGAHHSQNLHIPGEDLPGVVHGIELLKAINLSQRIADTQSMARLQQLLPRGAQTRAAVLGGGNTAMDVSRSLRRLGLSEVRILYRRSRAEMPAMPEEIEDAELEGVSIEYLVSPVRILGDESAGVKGLECIRMKLGEPDASGRRRPVPIAGSEFVIDLDMVVLAIGQAPDLSFLGQAQDIIITRDKRINVADVSFMTSREGVFAVGDAVTTDKMVVIEAIGMGKQAAAAIDAYLRDIGRPEGERPEESALVARPPSSSRQAPIARRELTAQEMLPVPRQQVHAIPVSQRVSSFAEIELGYTAEQAIAEAQRCLTCGPCSECQACVQVCQPSAIIHDESETFTELEIGAVLVADENCQAVKTPGAEGEGIFLIPPGDAMFASATSAKALGLLVDKKRPTDDNQPRRGREQFLEPIDAAHGQDSPRIGVFICQCGGEISQVIDTETVRRQASGLPDVVYTDILPFSCTPSAALEINTIARLHCLNQIVLAGCSCCAVDQICHSCTYQRVRCKHYLEGISIEYVNLREQCAWVHAGDSLAATAKASAVVSAAIAGTRVAYSQLTGDLPAENSSLILGNGTSALHCQDALGQHGVAALHIQCQPHQVRRADGQYIILRDGQVFHASALVLAPWDVQEAESWLPAFGRRELYPRVDARWDGLTTHRPGIFYCDPALDPAISGAAAAMRVSAWLSRQACLSPLAAYVAPERCRACSTCVKTCEFGAPTLRVIDKKRISSWIDPVICRGCGTCVARCPSGAIIAAYCNDEKQQAMLSAMLA